MVKCLPEFEYFTVFLKNKNIIFKIRRSKVTDYAALKVKRTFEGVVCCKFKIVVCGLIGPKHEKVHRKVLVSKTYFCLLRMLHLIKFRIFLNIL